MRRWPGGGGGAWAGWLLAVAGLVVGYTTLGWQGLVVAVTAIMFWLLLQFSRALRAVRNAADAPLGQLRSAVMVNARLRSGMTLPQVLAQTGSLGAKVETPAAAGEEVWRWEDAGQIELSLVFDAGRLVRWDLRRPPDEADADARQAAGLRRAG